jgi:hypothetical protein
MAGFSFLFQCTHNSTIISASTIDSFANFVRRGSDFSRASTPSCCADAAGDPMTSIITEWIYAPASTLSSAVTKNGSGRAQPQGHNGGATVVVPTSGHMDDLYNAQGCCGLSWRAHVQRVVLQYIHVCNCVGSAVRLRTGVSVKSGRCVL